MKATGPHELPIIFTAESVRAILENRKSQTRRLMNPQPKCLIAIGEQDRPGERPRLYGVDSSNQGVEIRIPYVVGDVLWVKEAWRTEEIEDGTDGIRFKEDCSFSAIENTEAASDAWIKAHRPGNAWRSPIYMPRWASRISLEVTEVRAQRVQDISEEDARAEGAREMVRDLDGRAFDISMDRWCKYTRKTDPNSGCGTSRGLFAAAWDAINGKRSTWARNDFVFAYTFRRIER